MAYLHQYPIDVIKNDRSFITHLATHDEDRNLVAGMIALGHSLDISVTAGGVENEDQASVLRELGCPAAQGYLYSHPVAPEQLTTLLDEIFPHSVG